MDVQPRIVDRLPHKDAYLAQVKRAVDAAYERRLLVIYVVVGFRPGFPEVSSRNKFFSAVRDAAPMIAAHHHHSSKLCRGAARCARSPERGKHYQEMA